MKILIFLLLFLNTLFARDALEKVTLKLQWMHQFQFAGYYIAKENGFYEDVGLDVEIKEFKLGDNAVDDVLKGKAQYGTSQPSLLIDKSQGKDIYLMSAILQSSPLVLIAKKSSGINTLEDFKNKRVMLTGTEKSADIFAMTSSAGIRSNDTYVVESKNKMTSLINDDVDIISAYTSSQVYLLKEQGIEVNIFNPKDYGFDFYNDILFTSGNEYKNHYKRVQNFNAASLKGWEYAFSHINETVDLILKKYSSLKKSKEALIYEAQELKKLAYYKTDTLGKIEKSKIEKIYDIYRIMRFIKNTIDLDEFILDTSKYKLIFSDKEIEWLKKHPTLKYSEINWRPLSIIENNKMNGIIGDYLDLISKHTGIKFQYVPHTQWKNVLNDFENGKLDILPAGIEHKNKGLISNVYKQYPMVIVTGQNFKYIENLKNLKDKTIAVPRYYSSYDYITQNYPNIKLKITNDIPEALLLVHNGKADAFIGHIATSLYYIAYLHLSDLKISGKTKFSFEHSFLIQKKYPELLSIINKVLDSISEQEIAQIDANWVHTAEETKTDYTLVWQILSVVSIVFLLFLYRQKKLGEYNKELNHQKDILHYQANYDLLTGLPNRILFNDRLQQSIQKSQRQKLKFALLFLDLDKFKHINDTLGHDIGDIVLTKISQRITSILRKEDTLARLGGDEFTIIMQQLKHDGDSGVFARKIIDSLVQPIEINGNKLYISTSIGISLYPKDSTSAFNLLKYADTAMYKAKDEGRNNFQFYSHDMTELVLLRASMETSLREALVNEEFIVYYQPQFNAKKNKLIGIEALIRWKHPTLGLISPDKFIPLAEETGLIVPIDQWMMLRAMEQVKSWYVGGLNPGILSLNLAMKQLKNDDFIGMVDSNLRTCDFQAKWLKFEVTESKEMIDKLKKLNTMGIRIAIDDFGTGYSSLSYLKRLPINTIKIDKSFVRDIPHDDEDVSIVKAIIALGSSLNLHIVAEGVETKEQKEFLLENGCFIFQGYFYSQPLRASQMRELLLEQRD